MSYFSTSFTCRSCSHRWEDLVRRSEKDLEHPCPECGTGTTRNFEVAHHTRASYVDGNGRFKEAKEAAKLNREMAGSNQQTKKEIAKEIKKLGYNFNK